MVSLLDSVIKKGKYSEGITSRINPSRVEEKSNEFKKPSILEKFKNGSYSNNDTEVTEMNEFYDDNNEIIDYVTEEFPEEPVIDMEHEEAAFSASISGNTTKGTPLTKNSLKNINRNPEQLVQDNKNTQKISEVQESDVVVINEDVSKVELSSKITKVNDNHYKIVVEDYVSEASKEIVDTLNYFNDKTTIVKAPTGSGKTHFILNDLPKLVNNRVNMFFPLSSQVEQSSQLPNVNNYAVTNKIGKVNVATYDSAMKVTDNKSLSIFDEGQDTVWIAGYRDKSLSSVNTTIETSEKVILMSATTDILKYDPRLNGVKTIEVVVNNRKQELLNGVKISRKNGTYVDTALDFIKEYNGLINPKVIELNSKSQLIKLKERMVKAGIREDQIAIIHSDNKDTSEAYKLLIEESRVEVPYLLVTEIIRSGINIKNDLSLVLALGTGYVDGLVQFLARGRNKVENAHIVISDKDVNEALFEYDVQAEINKGIDKAEKAKAEITPIVQSIDQLCETNNEYNFSNLLNALGLDVEKDNVIVTEDGLIDINVARIIKEAIHKESNLLLTNPEELKLRLQESLTHTTVEVIDRKPVSKVEKSQKSEEGKSENEKKYSEVATELSMLNDEYISDNISNEDIKRIAIASPKRITRNRVSSILTAFDHINSDIESYYTELFNFVDGKERIDNNDIEKFLKVSKYPNVLGSTNKVVMRLKNIFKVTTKRTKVNGENVQYHIIGDRIVTVEDIIEVLK